MRDKFVFSVMIYGAISQLSEPDFVSVMDAVLKYGFDGKRTQFSDPRLEALMVLIEAIIDIDNVEVEEVSCG